MTKILGVSGSQRAASNSRRLIERILSEAQGCGAETRMLDLRATSLSILQPDASDNHPNYDAIRELVLWADVIILGSPDYHGGMVGSIKNFLDHFWEEFAGKLFGYVVASHEKGLTVQDQMRTVVRQVYAWSLPYGIGFHGGKDADFDKGTMEASLEKRVKMMARDLTVYGGMLHGQFESDLAVEPTPPTFAARYK